MACHPLAGAEGQTPVYGVDASVWPDATPRSVPSAATTTIRPATPRVSPSSQDGPASSSHSSVSPARVGPLPWTCGDVRRLRPAQDANEVATEQIRALLSRREEGGALPLFVFDAGYDPVKVQRAVEGSQCQILVRLRAGRRFYGDPGLCGCGGTGGRGGRRIWISSGARMSGVSTWSTPSASSSRAWGGRRPGFATPSRRIGGRGLL